MFLTHCQRAGSQSSSAAPSLHAHVARQLCELCKRCSLKHVRQHRAPLEASRTFPPPRCSLQAAPPPQTSSPNPAGAMPTVSPTRPAALRAPIASGRSAPVRAAGSRLRGRVPVSLRMRVLPNPSLKLTRYGRHCKPGLSHSYYRLSPGLQYLPPRAA